MRKIILGLLIAACVTGSAAAADYHINRDASGKTVLTNRPVESSAQSVKTYDLDEATAAEIAATESANEATARAYTIKDLADKKQEEQERASAVKIEKPPEPTAKSEQVIIGIIQGHAPSRQKPPSRIFPRQPQGHCRGVRC
jgi:hypothetical protein